MDYSKKNNIEYREDSSNTDTDYDRNRIRQDINPVLELLNPSIHSTIGDLSEYMQALGIYLSLQVKDWIQKAEQESGLPNTFLSVSFIALSPFFQGEIISYLYARAQDGSTQ